jgi:hypothetical protein
MLLLLSRDNGSSGHPFQMERHGHLFHQVFQLADQTYPPKLSGSGTSRDDTGLSESAEVTRVSSISVTRTTPGIGSSTTSITVVSTAGVAFRLDGGIAGLLRDTSLRDVLATFFALFFDFLLTALLTGRLPGFVRAVLDFMVLTFTGFLRLAIVLLRRHSETRRHITPFEV